MTGCKRLSVTSAILSLGLALLGQAALANTYSWGGGDGPNWSDVLNWSPNSASPAIGDIAQFASGSVYTNLPTVDTTWSVDGLWQTGATPVTISSAGSVLTLMGTNTINGNLSTGIEMDPAAGALTINPPVTLGAAQTWLNNSGNLLTVSGNVNNNGKLLTISGSGNTSFGGIISGAGGLTKTGSGMLTVSANNSFGGNVTISGGTVNVLSSGYLGNTTTNTDTVSNATVVLNGWNYGSGGSWGNLYNSPSQLLFNNATIVYTGSANPVVGGNAMDRGFTVQAGGTTILSDGTGLLSIGQSNNSTYDKLVLNGALTLSGTQNGDFRAYFGSGTGGIVKDGTDTWIFGSAGSYSNYVYTGNTTINNGTLQIRSGETKTAIPYGAGNGNVVFSTAGNTAILDLDGVSTNINGLSQPNASTTNMVINNLSGTATLTVGNNNATSTFAGILANNTGSGGFLALTKTGTGALTLGGANTYTGLTTISGGTLAVNGSLSASSSVSVNANTLAGSGTIGGNASVTGNGAINLSGGTIGGTLTATGGNWNGTGTVVGAIAANSGSLYVNGSLTAPGGISVASAAALGGSGSVASGTTTVAGGGIISAGYNNAGSLALSGLTFASGGTINIGVLTGYTASVALSAGALTPSSTAGLISIDANLGALTVTPSTYKLISYTDVIGGAGFSAFNPNVAVVGLGTRQSASLVNNTNEIDLSVIGNTPYWSGSQSTDWAGTNAWILKPVNTLTTFQTNDSDVFDDTATSGNVTLSTSNVSPGSVVFSNSSLPYSLSGSFGIAGSTALTIGGGGSVTIANSNGYTGGTTLTNGRLVVNNNNALGSGTLTINGGTLDSTAGGITLANNPQAWNGDFTFLGSNNLNLGTGGVTLSGSRILTVNANTLTIGGPVNNGGNNLAITGAGSAVFNNGISGGGAVACIGPGTVTLSGSSNYGGGTLLYGGILNVNNNNALGTGTLLIMGGTLDSTVAGVTLANNPQAWNGDFTFNGTQSLSMGTGAVTLGSARVVTLNANTLTVGGAVNNGGYLLTVTAPGNASFSGVISGGGGLTKTGTGLLTLSGANTESGNVTISGGIVNVANTGLLGNGLGSQVVTVNGGATLSLAGWNYNEPGSFGPLYSFYNQVYLNNGTIVYTGSGNAVSTNSRRAFTVQAGGGTIDSEGSGLWTIGLGNNSSYNQIPLTGSGVLTLTGSQNGDFRSYITGTGGVTKNGAGTWTFGSDYNNVAENNTYTGNTTINNGTLKLRPGVAAVAIPNGSGKGNVIINSPGILDLNTVSPTVNGLSGNGTVTSGTAGAVTFTAGANDQTTTFAGTIQDGAGTVAFTKTGSGTLTLSGTSTYSGATTVNNGTLQMGAPGAIPYGSGKGSVTFNPANTATLDINGIDTTVNGLVQTTLASNNQVVNNGSGTHVLTVGAANTSSTFSGTLADNNNAGTGILSLTKTGSGTLNLGGANTYSGPTNVNAGTLYVAGSLNPSGTVSVAASAALGGNGSVGTVDVASGGILDFTQIPAYSALTATGVTFRGNASVNVANLNTSNSPVLIVTGSDTLSTGGSAHSVQFVLSGLAPTGSGSVELVQYTGDAIQGSGTAAFGVNASALGARFVGTLSFSAGYIDLNYSADHPVWTGLGNGVWSTTVQSPKNWVRASDGVTPTDFLSNDAVVFDDTATGTTLVSISGTGDVNPTSVTFGNLNNSYTLTGTHGIVGPTSVLINGGGAVTIANSNGYTGGTTLTSGVLNINNNSALGTGTFTITGGMIDSTTAGVTLANNPQAWNADITFNGSNNLNLGTGAVTLGGNRNVTVNANTLTVGGPIGDGGNGYSLTINCNGTLALAGSNSYSGGTTLYNGGLVLNNNGALGSGTLTIGGGTLDSTVAGVTLVNNPQIWSSGFTFNGTQNLNLGAGAVTFTTAPTVTLNANTLTVGGPVNNGGYLLTIAGSGNAVLAGAISGAGGLAMTGSGILTVAGANLYTGATTISGGTVVVGSGSTLYGGAYIGTTNMIVVSGGATVVFHGWGYGQPGAWGDLDDNAAGRSVDAATLVYAGSGYTATANNRGNWTVGADGATFDSEATGPGYWGWGVRTSGAFNSGWDNMNLQGTVTLTGSGNGDMQKALYGNGGIIKDGSGTWVLGYSQTNAGTHDDTYAGDTVINDGTLQIRATGLGAAIPNGASAGNVIINSPGVLDLNSRSAIINGLSGDGTVTSSATGALTLTVGDNDQTSTFSGTIQNGLGVLALTKTGAGVLTLTGTNTYLGGTTVADGTLIATNNEAIADGTNLSVGTDLSLFGGVAPAQAGIPSAAGGQVAPVPEPGTLALLAALLGSAALYCRLRRR